MNSSTAAKAGFLALAAAGFFVPFWPLAALGVALAGALGHAVLALPLALFFDLAWGAPAGVWGAVRFPFLLLACGALLARMLTERYLR